MKFEELQVVKTNIDFSDRKIYSGDEGTVVACLSVPSEAYLVEFVNDDGSTKEMFVILPEHLEIAEIQ